MAGPRYSILYASYDARSLADEISEMLQSGIKVIWFGSDEDKTFLDERFSKFIRSKKMKSPLLQTFVADNAIRFTIVDGNLDGHIDELRAVCSGTDFDLEQFVIEHSRSRYISVEASAGTGKTTIMVDRILYLLHTVDDIDLSQFALITFTNEATYQMKDRLQEVLLSRYRATGQVRYLRWMESESRMRVSTIHSFALDILKNCGHTVGFTKDVGIRSFRHDLDLMIKEHIDSSSTGKGSVEEDLGLPLYETQSAVHDYWDELMKKGMTSSEIKGLNWGKCDDPRSERFQTLVRDVLIGVDREYNALKVNKDSVSVTDFLRDLDMIIAGDTIDESMMRTKYLFVDEFQDTDDSQIRLVSKLVHYLHLDLFVVGDVKQSIYRFRGAEATAFRLLNMDLRINVGSATTRYYLSSNYRSSPTILGELKECFKKWDKKGHMDYKVPAKARSNDEGGNIRIERIDNDTFISTVVGGFRYALDDLRRRVSGTEPRPSDRVVALARTNHELRDIAKICYGAKIPVIVKHEGGFYTSDAVRDFYAMISSFVFHDPIHMFNFIMTPYCSLQALPDIRKIEEQNGDRESLDEYLAEFLEGSEWKDYDKEFRLKPVLSVLRKMISDVPVIRNYIARSKERLGIEGWQEDDLNTQVRILAEQYRCNLDKLMVILQSKLSGGSCGLYDIYDYLRLMIQTNREEGEADIDDNISVGSITCMTIHKSKGLEFDTVFLPYTGHRFNRQTKVMMVLSEDKRSVGWKCTPRPKGGVDDNKKGILHNDNFNKLWKEEKDNNRREEARVLYVALTRAIHSLNIYIPEDPGPETLAWLLEDGGM